ncbi:MAG: glycosyltransferase [Flavobacteriales bacterium]
MNVKKKKILLIGDMPNWAFHLVIQFIIERVEGYDFFYDFTVYNSNPTSRVNSDFEVKSTHPIVPIRKRLSFQRVPLLRGILYRCTRGLNRLGWIRYDENGCWRRVAPDNKYDLAVFLDYYMDKDADFSHVIAEKYVKGIFTEQFPPKGIVLDQSINLTTFVKHYLNRCDALLVGAPSIANIYSEAFNKPIFFANLCYDESLFIPKKRSNRHTFVIGWTGNPSRDFKGYYSHIVPAVMELQELGIAVELRHQFQGSIASLVTFWQDVDLALILSDADAGPSMFIEASLCGVPSVSTKIGLPAFVIEDGINGLFCERSVGDVVLKVRRIINDVALHQSMKQSIREDFIRKLGVEAQKIRWKNLFNAMLNE